MKDYYDILGVARDAEQADIKRAFRRLARDTHPDANPGDPQAEARFREVAEAYEVLSDPQRRRAYDRGDRIRVDDLFSTFAGFDDLLETFFGGGGFGGGFGGPRTAARGGRDVGLAVEVTLEEAAFGATREISFPTSVDCETCEGSGAAAGSRATTCERCGGAGALRMARRGLLGSLLSVVTCDRCGGEGQVISDPCRDCAGRGTVEGSRTLTIEVPPGVTHRSRLRLSGRGESGLRGAPTGDLYVEVRVLPHERFLRDGDDLVLRLPIGLAQASLGAEVEVPLLDGGEVDLDVPGGTRDGARLRVSGKGMPRLGRRDRGDLVVEVEVAVPSALSTEEEEALREYARRRGEAVREPRRRRGRSGR